MYVKAYEIIVVSASSGILEFCADTISIDALKKKYPACKSLVHIYKEIF
jgi:phosphatidylinositol 4-kinase